MKLLKIILLWTKHAYPKYLQFLASIFEIFMYHPSRFKLEWNLNSFMRYLGIKTKGNILYYERYHQNKRFTHAH